MVLSGWGVPGTMVIFPPGSISTRAIVKPASSKAETARFTSAWVKVRRVNDLQRDGIAIYGNKMPSCLPAETKVAG